MPLPILAGLSAASSVVSGISTAVDLGEKALSKTEQTPAAKAKEVVAGDLL